MHGISSGRLWARQRRFSKQWGNHSSTQILEGEQSTLEVESNRHSVFFILIDFHDIFHTRAVIQSGISTAANTRGLHRHTKGGFWKGIQHAWEERLAVIKKNSLHAPWGLPNTHGFFHERMHDWHNHDMGCILEVSRATHNPQLHVFLNTKRNSRLWRGDSLRRSGHKFSQSGAATFPTLETSSDIFNMQIPLL